MPIAHCPLPVQAGLHFVQVLQPSHPVHFSPLAQAGHSDAQHVDLSAQHLLVSAQHLAHFAHMALGLHLGHEAHPAHPVHFSPLAHGGQRAALHVSQQAEVQQEFLEQQESFEQQACLAQQVLQPFLEEQHPKAQTAASTMAARAMSLFMGGRLQGWTGGGQLRGR